MSDLHNMTTLRQKLSGGVIAYPPQAILLILLGDARIILLHGLMRYHNHNRNYMESECQGHLVTFAGEVSLSRETSPAVYAFRHRNAEDQLLHIDNFPLT